MAEMKIIVAKDIPVPYLNGTSSSRSIYEGIYNNHPEMITPMENEAGNIMNSFGKALASSLCICTLLGSKRYGVKTLTKIYPRKIVSNK